MADTNAVRRWNDDKPHRCPGCHAIAALGKTSPLRLYICGQCHTWFTRWPALAHFLPQADILRRPDLPTTPETTRG